MRNIAALAVALGIIGAAVGPLWASGVAAPVAQRGQASSCTGVDPSTGLPLSIRELIPSDILLCESAQVSVTVRASCAGVPLHVVLNIDRSGSMIGQPLEDAKDAAVTLVQTLDVGNHPDTLIGLVSHGLTPRRESPLTNSVGQIVSRIHGLQAGGEDDLPGAIAESKIMLTRGRKGMTVAPYDAMVILSDGGQTRPPQLAVAAARAAKGAGILVVAVCLHGANSHCREVRQMATSAQYYFEERSTSDLVRVFRQIAEQLRDIGLRSLVVEETVPDDLVVLADSVNPAPSRVSGATLRWDFHFASSAGPSIPYQLRPKTVMTYALAASKGPALLAAANPFPSSPGVAATRSARISAGSLCEYFFAMARNHAR